MLEVAVDVPDVIKHLLTSVLHTIPICSILVFQITTDVIEKNNEECIVVAEALCLTSWKRDVVGGITGAIVIEAMSSDGGLDSVHEIE